MSATATAAPAAPTIPARIAVPSPSSGAATVSMAGVTSRALLAVVLSWTAAVLSAASYVQTWDQRHPSPIAAGTALAKHP